MNKIINRTSVILIAISMVVTVLALPASLTFSATVEINTLQTSMVDLEAIYQAPPINGIGPRTAEVTAAGGVEIPMFTIRPALWVKANNWQITVASGAKVSSDEQYGIHYSSDFIVGSSDIIGDLDNSGIVSGGLRGVLLAGGTINNRLGGQILSNSYGIFVRNTSGSGSEATVINAGEIRGNDIGIRSYQYNNYPDLRVTNEATGSIISLNQDAILVGQGGRVVNRGSITGASGGILFSSLGAYDNLLTNSGTITGSGGTAIDMGAGDDTVILETGSVINGAISGGSGTDTIELNGSGNYSGVISNFAGLAKTGAGIWTLTGANTYTGKTTISGGKLWISSDANLGTAPASFVADQLTIDGGTLEFYSSLVNLDASRGIRIGSGGATIAASNSGPGFNEINGAISGTGDLTFEGLEGIRLKGSTANTFSGNTIINGGHIQLNKSSNVAAVGGDVTINGGFLYNVSSEQIPDGSNVTINANSWTINSVLTETIDQLSGSGSVKLYNGANLRIGANNGDSTFNGTIENQSGNTTGQITKLGSGTLILTGSNTYSGGTSINGGTLSVGSDSNLGDASGSVSINGGFLEFAGNSVALNASRGISIGSLGGTLSTDNLAALGWHYIKGPISGTGDLTKTGPKRVDLQGSAPNTFTGALIINQGWLGLDKDPNVAAVGGDIEVNGGELWSISSEQIPDNQSVYLAAGTKWSLNPNLSETIGRLNGDGTVTLSNNVDLRIGAGNSSSMFSGNISGTGSLTKLGAGTLILTGTNTYSGGTTVSAGTLQGTSSSLQGNITNNSNVTFDQGTDGTYAGIMSGTGSLTKQNTGSLIFTGAHTYTGTTTVTAGDLFVNGSLPGSVIINTGATLCGSGTVGSVTSSGRLAPGNSPGIINTGDLTLNSGSSLDVEINGTTPGIQHDQVNVTGTVTLNSPDLNITLGYSPASGDKYTIINNDVADTVTGTFNGLAEGATFNVGSPLFQITYLGADGNDVVISYLYTSTNFVGTAVTPNENAVATALDDINPTATGDMKTVIDELNTLSASQQRSAYNQMGGLSHTALTATSFNIMNQYLSTIAQQMNLSRPGMSGGKQGTGVAMFTGVLLAAADSPTVSDDRPLLLAMGNAEGTDTSDKWGIWARAYGAPGYRDGNDPASQYDYTIGGFAFGGDSRISDKLLLGISGGYSNTDINFDNLNDKGNVSSYQASLYGSYADGPWYVDGLFSLARNRYDTSREVIVGTINRMATAKYDGDEYALYAEGGYRFKYRQVDLQPLASLGITHLYQDSYSESGAGSVNLVVDDQYFKSIRSTLGFRVSKLYQTGGSLEILPEGRMGWAHEFSDDDYLVNARFAGSTAGSFVVKGDRPNPDSLIVGLGITAKMKKNLDFSAHYDADMSGDRTAHAFTFGAVYKW